MEKRYRSENKPCSDYQERMVELFDTGISLDSDKQLKKHIDTCLACQSYLESLHIFSEQMNRAPDEKLQPDPRILNNIIAYKKFKKALYPTNSDSILSKVWQLLEYRIPVYQALGGVVVVLMMFLYLSGSFVSHGERAIQIDYSGKEEGLTSSELYLVDSLSMHRPDRGQNAKEDSVLMNFLVPSM
jgi:hypothetical protein